MIDKIRRNLVIILILVLAFGAFSLSIYNVNQQPEQIKTYFQEHKSELKGDKGDQGIQGKIGKTGKTGSKGAQGWTGSTGQAGTTGSQGSAGKEGCTWLGWNDYYPYEDLGFVCP